MIPFLLWGCATSSSGRAGRQPDAPPDATFISVDDIELHYRRLGAEHAARGTVVLIHGFGASMETWRPIDQYLAEQLQVITFDAKGFGLSARPRGDYSPKAQAQLLWHALDQLGVSRAALVGHSWGASIVLAMALAEPARTDRVGVVSAYIYDEEVPAYFKWAQLTSIGAAMFKATYQEHVAARVELVYYDRRFATQERVDYATREFARPGAAAAALWAVMGQRFGEQAARYHSIKVPVLIAWGAEDRITPVRFGQRLASELSDASLRIYPHCGHMPMIEARHRLAADLAAFLVAAPSASPTVPTTSPESVAPTEAQ